MSVRHVTSMHYFYIWLIYFIFWVPFGTSKYLNISNTSLLKAQERIVNGCRCPIEDHPYMVSIQYTISFQHRCGGTLISEFWILTAAHCCLSDYKHGTFSAVAGVSIPHKRTIQNYLITRNYIYPDYFKGRKTHDIGLMELDFPIAESSNVRYVQFATYLYRVAPIERICKEVTVIGWGDQYAKNLDGEPLSTPIPPYDPYLHCVNLSLVDKKLCDFLYGIDTSTLICAVGKEKSACQKDSGGPLMCNGVQYGIVTFGVGCALGNIPNAFTRVELFEHFIRKVILRNKELSHLCKGANYLRILQYLLFVFYCK